MANKLFSLGANPASCVGSFLDPRELSRTAPVSRNFQTFLMNKASFEREVGIAPSHEPAVLIREYRHFQTRQNLPKKLDKDSFVVLEGEELKTYKLQNQGFFSTIAYYFGCYHQNLGTDLSELSKKRTLQAIDFLKGEPPATLIDLRNICIRVHGFSKEIKGMHELLQKSEEKLNRDTEELFCLARWICQFVQWFLGLFGGGSSEAERIDNRWILLNKEGEVLDKLSNGQFASTPHFRHGLRVGQTEITVKGEKALYGVYAQPALYIPSKDQSREEARFYGRTTFCLSKDGVGIAGWVSMRYYWNEGRFASLVGEGDYVPKEPLINRRLHISQIDDKCGRDADNDQPIMRKLMQLSVEVLLREGEKRLEFGSNRDESYLFCAGGFHAEWSDKHQKLTEKIDGARKQGKKFPDCHDEGNFKMNLYNDPAGSALQTEVDFGEGATTWGAIIAASPMLNPGTGPILPRFWHRNFFLLEKPEED